MSERSLYVVASAAPPVQYLDPFLDLLEGKGWSTSLILTPTAATWVDADQLGARVAGRLRVEPRTPQDPDPLPRADAVVAVPVTFNTLNKWASGISDTLALGLLNEALGLDLPVVAAPVVKAALRKHPAYDASVAMLQHAGVTIIDPDAVTIRRDDGTVTSDWAMILDRLEDAAPFESPGMPGH